MRSRSNIRMFGFLAAAGLLLLSACTASSASPGGGGSATIGATVGTGTSGVGTVLVDAQGFTLYHLKTEVDGNKIKCTGSCATTWPPLLLSSGVTSATAGRGVTGKLGTITRPGGGTQVTYNGMPLYTYSGDTAWGQTNGQGIQGIWFAVTPSMSTGTSGGGTSSGSVGGSGGGGTSGGGGGYGY